MTTHSRMFGVAEAADQRDLYSQFAWAVGLAILYVAVGAATLISLSRGAEPILLPDAGPAPAYFCLASSLLFIRSARRYSKAPGVLDGAPGNAVTVLGTEWHGVWVARVVRPDNGGPDALLQLHWHRGRRVASGTRGMLYRQGGAGALVTADRTYWGA